MRSRSSTDPNSTTILPFRRPSSTLTRVSNRSPSRSASSASAGACRRWVRAGRGGTCRATLLPAAMVSCFGYGDTALVERFISGTEVAVSVIDAATGPEALPAVEIVAADGVNDYRARYSPGMSTWHAPARVSDDVAADLTKVALRVHEVFGLRDLSRVDAIVDGDGRVHVLEANVSPGMTETSLLPLAVETAGLDLAELCRELVERAAARSPAIG